MPVFAWVGYDKAHCEPFDERFLSNGCLDTPSEIIGNALAMGLNRGLLWEYAHVSMRAMISQTFPV